MFATQDWCRPLILQRYKTINFVLYSATVNSTKLEIVLYTFFCAVLPKCFKWNIPYSTIQSQNSTIQSQNSTIQSQNSTIQPATYYTGSAYARFRTSCKIFRNKRVYFQVLKHQQNVTHEDYENKYTV